MKTLPICSINPSRKRNVDLLLFRMFQRFDDGGLATPWRHHTTLCRLDCSDPSRAPRDVADPSHLLRPSYEKLFTTFPSVCIIPDIVCAVVGVLVILPVDSGLTVRGPLCLEPDALAARSASLSLRTLHWSMSGSWMRRPPREACRTSARGATRGSFYTWFSPSSRLTGCLRSLSLTTPS